MRLLEPARSSSLDNLLSRFSDARSACNAYNDYLVDRFKAEFFFDEFSVPTAPIEPDVTVSLQDIDFALNKLSVSSAEGPDHVSAWYVKHFACFFAEPLRHLFELSLRSSSVPKDWKCATIVPLPKVKNPSELTDLRPISLTPVFIKMLERIIVRKTSHIWRAVINNDQFAYRPQSSTEVALTGLVHQWLQFLDTNKSSYIRVAALDFAKAFDSVEHSLLVGKILSYEFPQWFVAWVHDFLTNRSQRVRIAGSLSDEAVTSRGLPQGTVLGPLLFVLYTNDLTPPESCNVNVTKYADDQTWSIFVGKGQDDRADHVLSYVSDWCMANCMQLNERKCAEMIISNTRNATNVAPCSLNGVVLSRVPSIKILGVTLSDDLKWSRHLQCISAKLRSLLFALRMLRLCHSPSDMRYLFGSVFLPVALYCCSAWCNANQRELSEVAKLCQRAARLCYADCDFNGAIDNAVARLFKQACAPSHPLHSLLPLNANIRSTRRKFCIPLCRTERFRSHFIARGTRLHLSHQ